MHLYEKVDLILNKNGLSRSKLAGRLGVIQNTLNRYFCEEQQEKLCQHLWKILEFFPEISREWLFFDEGPMLRGEATPSLAPAPATPPAPPAPIVTPAHSSGSVPLIGFASCGVGGWLGTMTIPVPVEPPSWHSGMVAVMASGESMLPAGIGHGHICYCDTTKEPCRGEAVFVRQRDGMGTLKLFLGRSEKGAGQEIIHLCGWHDKKPEEQAQEPFDLCVDACQVECVAPIIYVRRRL